jgi:asparagine N-glycosylation enzyme membrane subunit Stt3
MDYVEFRSYDTESQARHGARRLTDGNVENRVEQSGDEWLLEVQSGDKAKAEGIFEAYEEITQLPPQGTPEDELPWMKRPGAWLIIGAVVIAIAFLVWKPWLWPFYLVIGVLLAFLYITSKRSSPDRYSS